MDELYRNKDVSVRDMHLSTRSTNALHAHGIKTAGDIAALTPYDWQRIHRLGKKSQDEVISWMEQHGWTISRPRTTQQTEIAAEIDLQVQFFMDVYMHRISFVLCRDEHGLMPGDMVKFLADNKGQKSGKSMVREVGYVLRNYEGLEDGYCILSML